MFVKINESDCTGCGLCIDVCPVNAIIVDEVAKIDEGKCIGCEACVDECPTGAIYVETESAAVSS